MKIKIFLIVLIAMASSTHAQTLKSPEVFLGYKLGEKFTPHYKIVNYFQHAAAAMPQMMKLEQYGLTNEGRPLLLAVIASEENFPGLEEIRKNNLRLTGLLNDKPADVQAPAVVWLSYNVHGNEASSSEVSMKTLYELLAPANAQTKQWLKNTIIIIDPCLNPDGRDRYVNWYNEIEGKYPNVNGDAIEHNEPWPGGRSNHYNFDLNRDWAWQTQIETQQRIKKYNEWMPVIHCDFHEQYPGNPYYFAPAAEPFHEVITPWQRNFQATVGKNHAKYFDANGWLYFTREYFDLFYPAYGDTYPIYNGAIGMTYEQAGHGRAGLALQVNDDTLTLKDRIEHHFTTSMSTIEVASGNAVQLNTEFRKYFDEGRNNGNGIYKTYVVNGANENKIAALKELFERNNISYAYAKQGTVLKGYNYFNGREESYTTMQNDLLVSAYQPKSTLLKVLFEPQSKLSDSATYDITAWSLPYAYGVQSYAVKEKLTGGSYQPVSSRPVLSQNDYGYLVAYNSFNDGKLLAGLLKNGIKIRYAEKDFYFNGKKYMKGTLVLLRSGNENKIAQFIKLAEENNAVVTSVNSGYMESGFDFGSDKLHLLKKPAIALLTGEETSSTSSGEVWHLFEQQLNYPISRINSADIKYVSWKNIDVLIIPDGYYKVLSDKDAGSDLKTWVRQGGKIIAIEGAVSQMAGAEWGLKKKKDEDADKKDEDKKPSYTDIKRYENRDKDILVNNIPGAIYKIEIDESHPLAFGYPSFYFSLKQNDNIYEFMKDGWNVGVIKKENQVSGFVGNKVGARIKDGTVIAVQQYGRGSVVYFADDPIFRSFWENGKLMFLNAVFLVGQ
ncbi:MAG: M14 metallopeptidase family protein [Ferruginibacter sp.]